ncbi:MAG: glycine betaine ABC transporter substrate-binding protein [Firmicutes bacterium]|nr:glycine betaine ABC transporter substrate-binding protein [Bacillota bacterium]
MSAGSVLAKEPIDVGSKNFTEQLILGKMLVIYLDHHGYDVVDRTGLSGTQATRTALESGEIDVYWEYTGTAWLVALKHDQAITDSQLVYNKVKAEDAQKNDLIWLDMAKFNNTYTLMMRRDEAEKLGIKTLSDLAAHVRKNPKAIKFGTDHEFYARPDGFPALEKLYNFRFDRGNVIIMDAGLTYKALRDGQVDVSMGFATDGRIAAFDLVNMIDDKKFFPVYNPAPVVRKEILDQYPELADLLNKIGPKLDTETMTRLNYEVDIEGKTPEEVAENFLKEAGLI